MTLRERLNELSAPSGTPIYGEPYQTPDGATVITVTEPGLFGPRPRGIFVISGGEAKWVCDANGERVALLGVLTGLVAAAFATAALLKRPPWPDTRIIITKHA
ncbi:hypothetical protein ACFYUD_22530 [Nocardia tengchongensis]|uniref:hypothetical protein n=1 Tax=Nocardia tengchongensis TaxID=2055889 RepID=UPI0036AB7379